MTEYTVISAAEYESLPCKSVVYRALRKRWVDEDTGKIKADAFFLRPNESGISVNIAETCSPQESAKSLNKCSAIASLHVGRVRQLGLDVVQDSRTHANLTGLPYQDDNLAEAERLAGLLAKQSRLIRVK